MDKSNGFFHPLFSKWTKVMVYFLSKYYSVKHFYKFVLSSQTEASSAGGQLARDTLDERQKCQCNGLL